MIRAIRSVLLGLMCTLTFGCTTYIGDYQYSPQPAVTVIPPPDQPTTQAAAGQPQQPPALAVLATVIGVHRQDNNLKIPDSVEVRIRIDDNGPDSVAFDPKTLQLENGRLTPFSPAIADPAQPFTLNPQQTAYVTVYFPFPPGHGLHDTYMGELQLRWLVQIGGQTAGQGANFRRVWTYDDGPYYYGPYYGYPAYPVVVGVHVGYGRRWR